MRKELLFITTNTHKVKEIRDLVEAEAKDLTIEHLDYDYPERQYDETEEVARESANYIRENRAIKKTILHRRLRNVYSRVKRFSRALLRFCLQEYRQ